MRASIGTVSWALVMLVVGSRGTLAQGAEADAHRYSVFAGPTLEATSTPLDFSFAHNVGLGISRDFAGRDALIRPRLALSYDQWVPKTEPTIRVGSLVAEGMFLPVALRYNVRPFLFGGVGLFSRLPMTGSVVVSGSPTPYETGADNYVGFSYGLGVELGRAFAQYRLMESFGHGPAYGGLNLGFRL